MEVIVGKMAGFCAGVNNAVKKAEEIINAYSNEAAAMAICNTIQELTEKAYSEKSADDINNIVLADSFSQGYFKEGKLHPVLVDYEIFISNLEK